MSRENILTGSCERLVTSKRVYVGRYFNNALKRFFDKIDRNCKMGECWIWIGASSDTDGLYGRFSVKNRVVLPHRFIYENFFGPIPKELVIDHKCNNSLCVNPYHLQAVSNMENISRNPKNIASVNSAKTHCIRGHEFNQINTYRRTDGGRQCRICVRLTNNKRRGI